MGKREAVKTYEKEYARYVLYFGVVMALAIASFGVAMFSKLSMTLMTVCAVIIAVVMIVIQSRVFLHMTGNKKGRTVLWSYMYTGAMMLIIVVGSMIIMYNMNHNMHYNPDQMTNFMKQQNKKGF